MKRSVVAIPIVCVVLLWAAFPVMESVDDVLVLTVNPYTNGDCPAESACFAMELRNLGPWPIAIAMIDLAIYPSLIGPSVKVNWLGVKPDKFLVLMPFTGQAYVFSINLLKGLQPPDMVYVTLTANVTVLYVTRLAELHSGKR